MSDDKVLPPRKLAIIRQALYDAKFALEQEAYGDDKEAAIRGIMSALDHTVDPAVDIPPLTDEQLAKLVQRVREAPTQGAAERAAIELAEEALTPSMTRALTMQDEGNKRVRQLEERVQQLEEEVRAERQKVARFAARRI